MSELSFGSYAISVPANNSLNGVKEISYANNNVQEFIGNIKDILNTCDEFKQAKLSGVKVENYNSSTMHGRLKSIERTYDKLIFAMNRDNMYRVLAFTDAEHLGHYQKKISEKQRSIDKITVELNQMASKLERDIIKIAFTSDYLNENLNKLSCAQHRLIEFTNQLRNTNSSPLAGEAIGSDR
ncbi:hypothetical protein [Pantoea cypripedii]|uniref:Uncharacterized protein n=1 Tax=Pantoea cypripedii TaxID=55209 RepID=A0A6B9GFM9_PANCY|nr:hypothetical protein [Pantoea cypripedii]QGY32215.1 hypothetical protein CUN67_24805 [Pantoea cypripedii]